MSGTTDILLEQNMSCQQCFAARDNAVVARIMVGTTDGLRTFDAAGAEADVELAGHDVRAVAPESWTRVWAVVDQRQIWRRDGSGWERVAAVDGVEAVCLADTRANPEGGILVGTREARLARIDTDAKVEFLDSFDHAPGRDDWFTPWGGPPDTRTISEDDQNVFVNVHVGGVLRSRNGGASWEATIEIGADVHQVATGGGRVYAASARGLEVSMDGGESWSLNHQGLHARYCRAVAVCGKHLLLSASDGPNDRGRAALYRSDLAGRSFERCGEGLPEWFRGNLDSGCVDALPDGSLAAFGSAEGDVYASVDEGASWSRVASGLSRIQSVRVVP
jgi:hypothetical protein